MANIEGAVMEGKLPEVRLAHTPFKVVSLFEPSGDQPQANCAANVLFGAITSVGFCTASMVFAIVNVLPEPVKIGRAHV